MPFTFFHGLIGYFAACALTKDKRLRALAFIAGMLPDLDGLAILFNMDLYYALHHELLHAPVYGLVFGAIAAVLMSKFFNLNRKQSFVCFLVFALAFALHAIVDVFFTNWPVKLLWPFSQQEFSYPLLAGYNWLLVIALIAMLAGQYLMKKTAKCN